MSRVSVLIVSGGAESVTVDLLQWAADRGVDVEVHVIVRPSLFAPKFPTARVVESIGSDFNGVLAGLVRHAQALLDSGIETIVGLPTEDDSAELLIRAMDVLGPRLRVSGGRSLPLGGLSKAELFDQLKAHALQEDIAPTIVVRTLDDLARAEKEWAGDFILKPDRKPWGASIPGGAKLLSNDLDRLKYIDAIERDLARGKPWIAQRKLSSIEGAERSACCVVAASGTVCYVEVAELEKYPSRGGSAVWVKTTPDTQRLRLASDRILSALKAEGVFELSFLADQHGRPRLIELNARPWLQIGLLQGSGVDFIGSTVAVLSGQAPANATDNAAERHWVSLERFALKLISGDSPGRARTAIAMLRAISRRPIVAVWSSRLPRVRWRWAVAMMRRALRAVS